MTETVQPNALDFVRQFNSMLAEDPELPEVQIMGGIASTALQHPGTEIIADEQRIVTPDGFLSDPDIQDSLALFRPSRFRQQGTRRDMDALVLSTDPAAIAAVEAIAEDAIGENLKKSVFGLHSTLELEGQANNPFGLQSLKRFVSDRYVGPGGRVWKALTPFALEIPEETLDSWQLEIDDEVYLTANPAVMVMNYLTRSISGLRAKDAEKVQRMAAHVFDKEPAFVDWLVDGPGKSHMELLAIFHTLRRAASLPHAKRTLNVGGAFEVRAGSVGKLRHHEAFLLRDADRATQNDALLAAMLKSRGLGIGESSPEIVELFQTFAEERLDTITMNR